MESIETEISPVTHSLKEVLGETYDERWGIQRWLHSEELEASIRQLAVSHKTKSAD